MGGYIDRRPVGSNLDFEFDDLDDPGFDYVPDFDFDYDAEFDPGFDLEDLELDDLQLDDVFDIEP